MKTQVTAFQNKLNDFVVDKQRLCYMTRAIELQDAAVHDIEPYLDEAARIKREAIALEDENASNAMLAFEEILKTLEGELRMWIALKQDEPIKAWNYLIDAQNAANHAVRAHRVAEHMARYEKRLEMLEHVLFPPQVFNSPGMVIRNARCSLCGAEYGECLHVKGLPYMGEFCARIIEDCQFNEVSIVDDPADKRCIIASFSSDGTHWIDRMTLREIDRTKQANSVKDYDGKETERQG